MKVVMFSPWDNAWVPYYKRAYEAKGHEFLHSKTDVSPEADLYLHGWTGGTTPRIGAKNFMFLRRYELFDGRIGTVDWRNVNGLICVNGWIKDVVKDIFQKNEIRTPVHLIYNGTDLDKWTFRVRDHGKKIGMACHVHPKKNLPLALQILAALPGYSLHIAGEIQDPCTAEYLNCLGEKLKKKIYLYGHIPHEQLNLWWDTMDYCLSTSISEGNPNNVIEAMAKGIKPIVHAWPGSEDQFEQTFNSVDEAVSMIHGDYESERYRLAVKEKFSLKNIDRVVELCVSP